MKVIILQQAFKELNDAIEYLVTILNSKLKIKNSKLILRTAKRAGHEAEGRDRFLCQMDFTKLKCSENANQWLSQSESKSVSLLYSLHNKERSNLDSCDCPRL